MSKRPNAREIEAEIAALDDCKKYIPKITKFGDDNHAIIDAGVSALADRMSVDMAYDCAGEGEPSPEDQAKIEAALWMEGDREQAPSKDWEEYKTRKG